MQNSILDWIEKTSNTYANKIAIVDESNSITYADFKIKSKALATEIIRIKNELNNYKNIQIPIAIYLEKNISSIVSLIGVAYSGNFYTIIDTNMPKERIKKILEIFNPAIVITNKSLSENFNSLDYNGKYIYYEDINDNIDLAAINLTTNKIIDTDLLYVLFTSGSTGIPKGVSISHRSVIDFIDFVTDTFNINSDNTFGNQAPFYFDNSILDIYSCIKTGATLNIIPQKLFFQPIKLLTYIKENNINTIFWVPSALIIVSKLHALDEIDLSNTLKLIMFCGEVMPNKQLNIWRKAIPNATYINLYGPTEITDACAYYIVNRDFTDTEPLPIGFAMKNTDILVLNEKNELVKPNEIGEIHVRGTSLSLGYYNNPEQTNKAFIQNPLNKFLPEKIYKTGDLAKYNELGELIYISRSDYQIKHLGHRIELGEIEIAISSIPNINHNCCIYDDINNEIVTFIDYNIKLKDLKNALKELIPDYMIPTKVHFIENMPLNLNGKIDRIKLKNEYIK